MPTRKTKKPKDKSHSHANIDKLGRDRSGVAKRIAKKKKEFLKMYKDSFGMITNAAARTGIDRTTYFRWCKDDKEFRKAVDYIQGLFDIIVDDKIKMKILQGDSGMLRFYASKRVKAYMTGKYDGFYGDDEEDEPFKFNVTIKDNRKNDINQQSN